MEENNGSYGSKNLVSIAIENPHLSIVACLIVVIIGILSLFKLPKDLLPSGDIKIGNFDYQIVSNGLVEKISDMDDFPMRAEYGIPVYLSSIGKAEDSGQIQTNIVLIDGKQQVYVPVYRQPGGNSIRVVEQVKSAIKKLEKRLVARIPRSLLRKKLVDLLKYEDGRKPIYT